jgi:hypothetical protein
MLLEINTSGTKHEHPSGGYFPQSDFFAIVEAIP